MNKIPLTMYRKVELIRLSVMTPFAIIMTADRWYTLLLALLILSLFFYKALFSEEPSEEEEQKKQKPHVYEPIHKLNDINMGMGSIATRDVVHGFKRRF